MRVSGSTGWSGDGGRRGAGCSGSEAQGHRGAAGHRGGGQRHRIAGGGRRRRSFDHHSRMQHGTQGMRHGFSVFVMIGEVVVVQMRGVHDAQGEE